MWVRLDEHIHSTNAPSLIYLSVLHLDVSCFPPFGGCYEQRYNKRVFLCRCVPGRGGGCHSHQQAGVGGEGRGLFGKQGQPGWSMGRMSVGRETFRG